MWDETFSCIYWGGVGRDAEMWGDVWRYMGRYGEMWGDVRRYGEMCGAAEMWYGEMWDETFFFGGEMVQPLAPISSGC